MSVLNPSLISRLVESSTPWGAFCVGALAARSLKEGIQIPDRLYERAAQLENPVDAEAFFDDLGLTPE